MNKDYKKDKGNWAKKEISLLTLLANESTDGSRKILKKYNKSDAVNHKDLESKLAELYFSTVDKVELEKEMAKIHPHREWLIKYEVVKVEDDKKEPEKKEIVLKEEIKIEQVTPDVKVIETKSKAEGDYECPCLKKLMELQEQKSNANGDEDKKTKDNQTILAILGVVGIIAVLGVVINKK
jgi:hypothetical protein